MSVSITISESASVLGLNFPSRNTVTADGALVKSVTLAAAKIGQLTTRTDSNTGILTMASGHGITTAARLDLYWTGGSRRGITVGTVSGDSVPISGGAGYVLPTAATAVFILTGGLKDILIEDEDGNQARPSAPVLLDGIGGKLDDANLATAKFRPFVITRKADLTTFPGIT